MVRKIFVYSFFETYLFVCDFTDNYPRGLFNFEGGAAKVFPENHSSDSELEVTGALDLIEETSNQYDSDD